MKRGVEAGVAVCVSAFAFSSPSLAAGAGDSKPVIPSAARDLSLHRVRWGHPRRIQTIAMVGDPSF